VIGSEPLDLVRKIEKAKQLQGPRMIIALSPCPTGWGYDPKLSVDIGRLAVKTGVWPLKEYIDGEVTHTRVPRERPPVAEYLKLQGRFAHLFQPQSEEALLSEIQQRVDSYWAEVVPQG
jgi:pyruvate ferredoxin oxidoreductase beta subunit